MGNSEVLAALYEETVVETVGESYIAKELEEQEIWPTNIRE